MSIANTPVRRTEEAFRERENSREMFAMNKANQQLHRTTELDPLTDSWKGVAAGSVVPLGVAGAAAFATYVTTHERVAITAWIAVAVVGSASVISAAAASRRRTVSVDRGGDPGKTEIAQTNKNE